MFLIPHRLTSSTFGTSSSGDCDFQRFSVVYPRRVHGRIGYTHLTTWLFGVVAPGHLNGISPGIIDVLCFSWSAPWPLIRHSLASFTRRVQLKYGYVTRSQ